MGILNVTPDSFSDGGTYTHLDEALKRVEEMLEEGAKIIDIGGESTRPAGKTYGEGAEAVDLDRERSRVIPVIEAMHKHFPEALISIDTYKPAIAREAIAAGAHIINDITGLRLYPETAQVAVELNAPLVLMHSLGTPGSMPHQHEYQEVVQNVKDSLTQSIQVARKAGEIQIVTDPGFGFGKSVQENLDLINQTNQFLDLGYPVLVGISRKSAIGKVLGTSDNPVPIESRLFGTLGATAIAVLKGASIVRTHDVKPTVEMLHVIKETAYTQ